MNKRKGFADQIAKTAKQQLQPVPSETEMDTSDASTVHIGGHFPKEVAVQLNIIAAEKGLKKREVLAEAFNMYFRSNKRPPIAN